MESNSRTAVIFAVTVALIVLIIAMSSDDGRDGSFKEKYGPPPGTDSAPSRQDILNKPDGLGLGWSDLRGPRFMEPGGYSSNLSTDTIKHYPYDATTWVSVPDGVLEDEIVERYASQKDLEDMASQDIEVGVPPADALGGEHLSLYMSQDSLGAGSPFQGSQGQARSGSAMLRGVTRS